MTKHLGRRITRISVLLPAVFAALVFLILILVSAGWLQSRNQANTLSEIATRDIKVRIAVSALINATNDINTRLVGVLATVQSSSSSAPVVEKLFVDLRSNWAELNGLLSGDELRELVLSAQRYANLAALEQKILETLRGTYIEQVAQIYDEWLSHAGPFRTDLQALVTTLDDRGAQKVIAILAGANRSAELSLLLGAIGGIVGFIAGCYVVFGVARPLSSIERAIACLTRGDYQTAIKPTRRKDEIGKIIETLCSFKSNLAENEVLRADQASLADRATRDRREVLVKFTRDLETNICAVAEAVGAAAIKIESSVSTTSDLIGRTDDEARIAAAAAAKASKDVQSVAGASKQLAASIEEIGLRVSQSTEIAVRAAGQAERANLTITGLRTAVVQIEQVVGLIRAIAGQTNLLALNATIEAARAGDAGRGFSVVASEVKQLAAQTARATDEITSQIAAVKQAGQNVLDAIGSIGSTIEEINGIAAEIAGAVREQESATVEIARSVDEVASGAGQISGSVDHVSDAASETGAQAAELKIAAGELSRHSMTLQTEIGRFVKATQAA